MKKHCLSWSIFGLAAFFVFYQFLLQASPSVMIQPLMRDLSINVAHVGILSASFLYPYVLLQIPAGLLVDRLGPRRVLMMSVLLCGIASLLFGMASSYWMAEGSRMLMGVASAPAVVCAMYLAIRWFPSERFAFMAGMVEMLGMFGGAVGEYTLAKTVVVFGWRETLFLCAALALLLLLFIVLLVRDCHTQKVLPGCNAPIKKILKNLWQVVQMPRIWVYCVYGGCLFSLVTAFAGMWAVPFLEALYHTSIQTAATASAIAFVGMGLGAPLAGFIAGRLKNYKMVMLIASSLCCVLLAVIVYGPAISLAGMWVLLFLLGLASGAYVLPFDLVKCAVPEAIRGTAMGFTNMMVIMLGAPLLQPLIGGVLLFSADYRWGLAPLMVFLIFAWVISLVLKNPCSKKELA